MRATKKILAALLLLCASQVVLSLTPEQEIRINRERMHDLVANVERLYAASKLLLSVTANNEQAEPGYSVYSKL